jgi:GGDEF domain-containing protein
VQAKKKINEQIQDNEDFRFAVVVCDINGLKSVNDTMGHHAGDELIKTPAPLFAIPLSTAAFTA